MKANKAILILAGIFFILALFILTPLFRLEIRDIDVVALAVGFIGASIALIALYISLKSDKRMEAMANLEFYEKMAMVQQYIMDMSKNDPDEWNKAYADKIFYDLKGAKQLKKWVKDPNIAKMFNDEIQTLINKALTGQKHEHLIKRLQEAKEDC